MRAAILLVALLTVGVAAGSLSAATTNGSPKNLILTSSDMPSGAKRVRFGATSGTVKLPKLVHGKAAYTAYRFKNGKSTELVSNAAGVVTSGNAHAAFLNLKKRLGAASALLKPLRLPKYGDEQVGYAFGSRVAAASLVLVRKGSTIWELVVAGAPSFSKAKSTSELEKYAHKAAGHVG